MQFACESCKAQLQIADEKVRGKRLIVRCKRCGAKIGISDPALGAPRPKAPQPSPKPSAPAPAVAAPAKRPGSDTESTRAMDSDMLEKALEASKTEDLAALQAARAQAVSQPPPQSLPAGDSADWFAMIHGKQAGPMTRAELTAKINEAAVGPRTYLWKDGMESWQRARDLAELAALFPQLPEPSVPPPPLPVAAPLPEFTAPSLLDAAPEPARPPLQEEERTAADPLPLGERAHQEQVAKQLFNSAEHSPVATGTAREAADLAKWASDELKNKSSPAAPRPSASTPMFAGAAPPRSGAPIAAIVVVAALAVAAAVLWLTLGGGSAATPKSTAPEEKKEPAAVPAPAPVTTVPAKAPETPPPPPAAQKPPEPAQQQPQVGLTADQVRRKLDENKAALQGCIDEALRRDPNLRVGKIHIATTIAPSGQVTAAKIDKSTVDQSPLGACLRRATRRISFPQFAGDAFDVDIPIVVTAGE